MRSVYEVISRTRRLKKDFYTCTHLIHRHYIFLEQSPDSSKVFWGLSEPTQIKKAYLCCREKAAPSSSRCIRTSLLLLYQILCMSHTGHTHTHGCTPYPLPQCVAAPLAVCVHKLLKCLAFWGKKKRVISKHIIPWQLGEVYLFWFREHANNEASCLLSKNRRTFKTQPPAEVSYVAIVIARINCQCWYSTTGSTEQK